MSLIEKMGRSKKELAARLFQDVEERRQECGVTSSEVDKFCFLDGSKKYPHYEDIAKDPSRLTGSAYSLLSALFRIDAWEVITMAGFGYEDNREAYEQSEKEEGWFVVGHPDAEKSAVIQVGGAFQLLQELDGELKEAA